MPRTAGRDKISTAPRGCCLPALAPAKFSNVHKGHGACPATSYPKGLWSIHSGHCPPLQVAIKIISIAKAPVEFSRKFLPREISSLNATYKHLNVVGRDPNIAHPHPAHPLQPALTMPAARPPPTPFPTWDHYA